MTYGGYHDNQTRTLAGSCENQWQDFFYYYFRHHLGDFIGFIGGQTPGIAQAQSPQLLYDLSDGVDLPLVIGR